MEVHLNELKNSGKQCSVDVFRSLRAEVPLEAAAEYIQKACFDILVVEPGLVLRYPIYSSQTYVAPGNNLEVKPLPIYEKAFEGNHVYR